MSYSNCSITELQVLCPKCLFATLHTSLALILIYFRHKFAALMRLQLTDIAAHNQKLVFLSFLNIRHIKIFFIS
jgi:hypothetical protein